MIEQIYSALPLKYKIIIWGTAGGLGLLGIILLSILGAGAGASALKGDFPILERSAGQVTEDKKIANRWENEANLSSDLRKQIEEQGFTLSHGLLEAIWAITGIPIQESADILAPRDVKSEMMKKTVKTTYSDGSIETATHNVIKLVSIRTYNGVHRIIYKDQTTVQNNDNTVITTTEPVVDDQKWDQDYSRINTLLDRGGLKTDEDRLVVYRQAIAYDRSFGDPIASSVLIEQIGGVSDVNLKDSGVPLPPEEITKALKEAIRLTHVDESHWLPAMQVLVMRESGGNPHAVAHQDAWYSARWGRQRALGLCQVMPPTFMSNKLSGHEDIFNPVDNAIAAINYIEAAWGDITNIPGLLDGGTYKGY